MGAVAGVTAVEGIALRGFRIRLRGEPSEVVALGSSFSYVVFSGIEMALAHAAQQKRESDGQRG